MPSTVYKGDLAEVSFAPETGLKLRIGTDVNSDCGMTIATTAGNDFTELTFKTEVNTTLFEAGGGNLKFPKNMLVGSQLVFTAAGGTAATAVAVAVAAASAAAAAAAAVDASNVAACAVAPA